jgi:hypothetical protein
MPQALKQKKKGFGCLPIILVLIGLPILAIGGFIFFASAGLRVSDEEVLKTYQPSAAIAEIAEKTFLTQKGLATFYRDDPELVDGDTFRKYCFANGVEALACNAPKPGGGPFGGRKIFLLNIEDPNFEDHKYSAAVHEMLHSAYTRLSSSERKEIDNLLNQELARHQDDPHLTGPIEILKSRGSKEKDILDELHAKFGVEYIDISEELEEYYSLYFSDRAKIVDLFASGGFNSRIRRMEVLRQEAVDLDSQLRSMKAQLGSYQNSGDDTSYNNLVGPFNNLVVQYNSKANESQRIYNEVKDFYTYFNPDYQPLETAGSQ